MVVRDVNVAGSSIPPSKDNSPLIVDSDTVETLQIATQRLQSVAGGSSQIVWPSGVVDHIELPSGNLDHRSPPNPFAELTGCEESFGVPIRKGLDRHHRQHIPACGIPRQGIPPLRPTMCQELGTISPRGVGSNGVTQGPQPAIFVTSEFWVRKNMPWVKVAHIYQLNPNNQAYRQSRGEDHRPDDWEEQVREEQEEDNAVTPGHRT
jgi:hypothetical protein